MSTKKKGILKVSGEWKKHLRPSWKRIFWKSERAAEKTDIKKRLKDNE